MHFRVVVDFTTPQNPIHGRVLRFPSASIKGIHDVLIPSVLDNPCGLGDYRSSFYLVSKPATSSRAANTTLEMAEIWSKS
jgi:hypothetical protein